MINFITNKGVSPTLEKRPAFQYCIMSDICSCFIGNRSYSTESSVIDKFWENFYAVLLENLRPVSSNSNVTQYQDVVFRMLRDRMEDKAGLPFNNHELMQLQLSIEEITTQFDDIKNLYQVTPDLINKMICKDKPTAKEYLKSCNLSTVELSLISHFDQYTLEAMSIHVLGTVFNSIQENPAVRVSTLIEQLDSAVRIHASLLISRKKESTNSGVHATILSNEVKSGTNADKNQQAKGRSKMYVFGVFLVEFLENRGLISLSRELSFKEIYVAKKKGKYYIPNNYYAMCNFDLSLLPIKLNLPMVCEPLPWANLVDFPSSLSDLVGGYLSGPTGDIYFHRYRLLTSRDLSHFYIKLEHGYSELCGIMNTLQSQAFEINKEVLTFILNNHDRLVKSGLLMPKFLASLNLKEAADLLRVSYFQDQSVMKVCNYHNLLNEFMTRVQRARYETFVLKLASAYDGYRFYLPAFLDFRGRIYRSGVLHFHERDLARSLIVFSPYDVGYNLDSETVRDVKSVLSTAAAFHYKKFTSYEDAYKWYLDNKCMHNSSEESLIQFAVEASAPFQFISKALCIEGDKTDPTKIPITQDASASAYQLMSYFLLDKEMAMRTNLIPSDGKINDVYTFFLEELKDYLPTKLDPALSEIICSRLTRKLVKGLFMPLIYGKSVISMANDIKVHLSSFLNSKECYKLASLFSMFWNDRFPQIVNLITLVRDIGWFSSALGRPIYYSIPHFTTVQDYMKTKTINIWVYDRLHKKRRQLTLRIPTLNRDRRKTVVSTFANFIHQKDARLAMHIIADMHKEHDGAPIYTVHDNFITTALYAGAVPQFYIDNIVRQLGDPLFIINEFISHNLVDHTSCRLHYQEKPIPLSHLRLVLERLIPHDLSKKNKLTWNRKIDSLLNAYVIYVNTVCSRPFKTTDNMILDDKWTNYTDDKWTQFKSDLKKWGKNEHNYCTHL